jgi:tetratricopeptide (TPR) repeat protein
MKRLSILLWIGLTSAVMWAQKSNVTSAYYALDEGDLKSAKTNLDEAILNEKTISDPKAWYYYAETYSRIFRQSLDSTIDPSNYIEEPIVALDKARAGFLKAFELDPELKKAPAPLPRWMGVAVGTGTIQGGYFNMGVTYLFDEPDYERAYALFGKGMEVQQARAKYLGATPDTALMFYLGYSAEKTNRTEEAVRLYQEIVDMQFKFVEVYDRLSRLLVADGQVDKALAVLDVGQKMFPDLVISRLNIYLQTDQLESRLAEFEAATLLEPDNADLMYALGTIYSKLLDTAMVHGEESEIAKYRPKTLTTYERVLAIDPTHHGANFNMGVTYYNDAMEVTRQMNALPPRGAEAEYNKLNTERTGKLKQALPFLEAAYKAKPDDEVTIRALRETYVRLDMMDKLKELNQ